jgi:proteasome lid subunit RPN8/RPN11
MGMPFFISKLAEEKVRNHAAHGLRANHEVMGLLLGEIHTCAGDGYALARDIATAPLEANEVQVRFDPGRMEELCEALDTCHFHYVVVGWYHSHLGYGCFLSETDVDTQGRMFGEPEHCAVVVDPVQKEMAAFRMNGHGPVQVPLAVYWEKYQSPYRPR